MQADTTWRIRVLIAEDETSVRDALAELIRRDRSLDLVGTAADASEAVDAAHRTRPDVALVDVKMPGGGGPRAARGIREGSPETRIVALSAYEDHGAVQQMLAAGAIGYLVKGVPIREIVDALHRAFRGESILSPQVTGGIVRELADHLEREETHETSMRERVVRVRGILEDGGPEIVFQPIVNLQTHDVVGLEALSRFPHALPDPESWFAEAAAVGLRTELEIAAVRAALRAIPHVPSAAYLSVNVSPDVVTTERCLEALGDAPADRLVIEVTEHAPVQDYLGVGRALEPLRRHCARLAVYDAGAGFASLRHILRLSPDIIKLDIALTRDIDKDRARRALASGLIAFASEMGAAIVAEGVETEGEIETLRDLGVLFGQGFFLAEPASIGPSVATVRPPG